MLDQWVRFRPVAPQQVDLACGDVGPADGKRMVCLCRQPDRLAFGLGRFAESAELGQAQDQPATVVNRWRGGESGKLGDPLGGQHGEVGGGQQRS